MQGLTKRYLEGFQAESNLIERAVRTRAALRVEVDALLAFVRLDRLSTTDVTRLARVMEPTAQLRGEGVGVTVGRHVAPPGGKRLALDTARLLTSVTYGDCTPYVGHVAWLQLHPLTDCNGRTGRAVYLWHSYRHHRFLPGRFLQQYYYDSLEMWDEAPGGDWSKLIVKRNRR